MRPRYRHLLLPLDFTAKNRSAVDVAVELAKVNEARVTLLHVIEPLESVAEDADIRDFLERCTQKAEAELERYSQIFETAGLAVEFKTRKGHRPAEIVQFANEHDVDLIIMSSHPLDPEHPVRSLATVSYQVSVGAVCSVLLVKNRVATDGVRESTN